MVRGTRVTAVLGAVMILLAAGCGTASENPLAPEARPSRDSDGLGVGGNLADDGSTTTTTSTAPVAESDSTKRGLGVGGN